MIRHFILDRQLPLNILDLTGIGAVSRETKFNDSAFSHHIYTKHLENFDSKLLNFKIGIVRSCSAVLLNRLEDYFIYSSKADIISLNRYKVVT